jgi:hypothetical protein
LRLRICHHPSTRRPTPTQQTRRQPCRKLLHLVLSFDLLVESTRYKQQTSLISPRLFRTLLCRSRLFCWRGRSFAAVISLSPYRIATRQRAHGRLLIPRQQTRLVTLHGPCGARPCLPNSRSTKKILSNPLGTRISHQSQACCCEEHDPIGSRFQQGANCSHQEEQQQAAPPCLAGTRSRPTRATTA